MTGSRSASGATGSPRKRLEGLVDAPRPGAARTISDEVVGAVVVETLETTPKDATQVDQVDGPAARDQPTDRQ